MALREGALVTLLLLLASAAGEGAANHLGRGLAERFVRDFGNFYLPLGVSPSSPCGRALHHMLSSLTNSSSSWAHHMVDSWGKNNDGYFFGHMVYTGSFDGCLTTTSPDDYVKGKHCMIYTFDVGMLRLGKHLTRPPLSQVPWRRDIPEVLMNKNLQNAAKQSLNSAIVYGSCMPEVCTELQLQNHINEVLWYTRLLAIVQCSDREVIHEFTNSDIGFLSLVAFLTSMILCSSLVDMFLDFSGNTRLTKGVLRYLLVFSAYTNLGKIFQANPVSSPGTITCLNAMRVLSMVWIIYLHQQSRNFHDMANQNDFGKWFNGLLSQIINNAYPSVDTFFLISGLLVACSVLREADRTRTFNIILFFLHRILRLVPPIGITVGFAATVLRFFVTGPHRLVWYGVWWPACQKYWWRDVVLLNNFLTDGGNCLGHTWYVSADFQLYLVAPLIILPLYFYRAIGKAWLFVLTLASAVIPAAITYSEDLPPTVLMNDNDPRFMELIYFTPWCRAGPWLAGIWLGYVFHRQGRTKLTMSPVTMALGWTVAAFTGLLVVFGMFSYNTMDFTPYDVMTQLVYGGLHRLAWGAALAWVVFACHNGCGGLVDDFLSHPVWQPLSRLTYTIYLVAMPLQVAIASSARTSQYFTHVNTVIATVGALAVSIPVAVLVSLMAEIPILGLEKMLLRPSSSPARKQASGGDPGAEPDPQPHRDHSSTTTRAGKPRKAPLDGFDNASFTAPEGEGAGEGQAWKGGEVTTHEEKQGGDTEEGNTYL